ncbi:UNVERIFIED_CONTAM: hypothetical protein Sindi_2999700, partial [Sesamum indicum]
PVACEHGGVKGGRRRLAPPPVGSRWHPHGRVLEGGLGAGGGQGQGGPPAAPKPRPSSWLGRGLCWPCFGGESPARDSGGALERGLRCCVRPMPICIVCAECLPVRNGKPSGACFDCDLLKHGQHKPRPSKGWSVGPLMLVGLPPHKRTDVGAVGIRRSGVLLVVGEVSAIPILGALASSPVACEHGGVKGGRRRLAPPTRRLPVAPTQGRVWSSSSSVARDPEISSTWLAKCRQSRHARLPHGSWGMLLGALASSPSPAKVEASHRQVGPVPRFVLLGSQLVLRPESSCLPGHALGVLAAGSPAADARMRRGTAGVGLLCSGIAYVMGRVSGDWRVWACLDSLLGQRQHPPQAASVVGPSALLPLAAAFHCPERPVFALRCTPRAAARGGPQGARCVPRPAHGRTCPGRWPIASSPDLSDAEHTVGTRASASVCPESKRSTLRANDARHRFGLVPCGRRSR